MLLFFILSGVLLLGLIAATIREAFSPTDLPEFTEYEHDHENN